MMNLFRPLAKNLFVSFSAFCACMTVRSVFGHVQEIKGYSMSPALNPEKGIHDFVVLSKRAVRKGDLERGDIVVFKNPEDPEQILIRRVIAWELDVIKTPKYKEKSVRIPYNHFWAESDNRNCKFDSNSFGPVNMGLIISKATRIVWPPHRIRPIKRWVPLSRRPLLIGSRTQKKINN